MFWNIRRAEYWRCHKLWWRDSVKGEKGLDKDVSRASQSLSKEEDQHIVQEPGESLKRTSTEGVGRIASLDFGDHPPCGSFKMRITPSTNP